MFRCGTRNGTRQQERMSSMQPTRISAPVWQTAVATDSGQTQLPLWAANRCVGRVVAALIGRLSNRSACPRKDFRGVFFPRKFFRNSVAFNVPGPDCRRLEARKKIDCCRMRFWVPHACRQFALGLSQRWPTLLMCFNRNGFGPIRRAFCLDVALACRRLAARA